MGSLSVSLLIGGVCGVRACSISHFMYLYLNIVYTYRTVVRGPGYGPGAGLTAYWILRRYAQIPQSMFKYECGRDKHKANCGAQRRLDLIDPRCACGLHGD